MKTQTEDKRTSKPILFVGLDVHKESISVAVAEAGSRGEIRHHGAITNDLHAIETLMQKLKRGGHELRVCYEAGPCGFGIARRLLQLHVDCVVIAPSLIPKKSGDRQKNDKRDATKLARLHRAGELTALGLNPSVIESGDFEGSAALHRHGRGSLRALLIQASKRLLTTQNPLRKGDSPSPFVAAPTRPPSRSHAS